MLLLKHLAMQTQDWAVSLLHSTVMVLLSVLVVQTNTAEVYYLSSLPFTLARNGYINGIASAAYLSPIHFLDIFYAKSGIARPVESGINHHFSDELYKFIFGLLYYIAGTLNSAA